MSALPEVSVVIPTMNRPQLVRRAVNSVLAQTYSTFEIIVVDDGSDTDVKSVLADIQDSRLQVIRHEKRRGASAARNTGIDAAQGRYVAFLDDDDEWLSSKLTKQVQLLDASPPDVGMVYCWMDYFDNNGQMVLQVHPRLRGNVFGHVLDRQRLGGCPSLLVRHSVVEEIGGFDECLPRGNDGDFIRRVCLKYKVDFVPKVLVRVHVGHGSEQISRSDEQGIRNAILGQKTKLVKFRDELYKYPKQTAGIYMNIALHYAQVGEWRNSIVFYVRAIRVTPLSPIIYGKPFAWLKARIARLLGG